MKKKEFWVFFILPYFLVLGLFTLVSHLNRNFIQTRVEALVQEQLSATASILKVNIKKLLEQGLPEPEVAERYSGVEDIYFIALLDSEERILDWRSRFEGYLPFSRHNRPAAEFWILDSPEGQIFNHYSSFTTSSGAKYNLYLGYSLKRLDLLLAYSWRNFYLILGILAIAGLIIFAGVYRLHSYYQHASEEALLQAQEKERFKEISGFTAGVAHEVKNPLNSLTLLFELLEKKAPDELIRQVNLGKKEIQKIGSIIDRFSEVIKPLSLKSEKVIFNEILTEELKSLQKEAEDRGVRFEAEVPELITIKGDRLLLGRVIHNLIKNALEASGTGQTVKARATIKKKNLLFSVEDEGPGIDLEKFEEVFEPFLSTKSGGLGVGLYLVRKIVEAHQGKIYLKNKHEGGTIFSVEIPGGKHEQR
jgi:signal transduction histidine kinase